jgi:uncharacterized protein
MFFKREVVTSLLEWKENPYRKPLVLRGARQVGKTTLVKQFSAEFDQFIALNLEQDADARFFRDYNSVQEIWDALLIEKGIIPDTNSSFLLFIDEIQEQPEAIQLLRYFYEELPHIHVVAAGSLLEFKLSEVPSFPVGRIEYRYVYPFNFSEFLHAMGNAQLVAAFQSIPVRRVAHQALLQAFHDYALIGGMPEVVHTFMRSNSVASLTPVYESIWQTYKEDVEKYTANNTEKQITRHILQTAPAQIDQRIKFQNFGNSNYRSREVGECFRKLDAARLLHLFYPTTDMEPPFKPDFRKAPRIQFLDTGIVNYALGIQTQLMSMEDLSQAYKGALIPHLINQELMSVDWFRNEKSSFWVRDKAQSSAEVDVLLSAHGQAVPVEIKSGPTGSLKSLHEFLDRSTSQFAIRIYGGEYGIQIQHTPNGKRYVLMHLPYYLGTRISSYIHDFFEGKLSVQPIT